MVKSPEILTLPPGAEINCGFSEDSDSFVLTGFTQVQVVGPVTTGSLPVRIIEDGVPSFPIYYYHQPELKRQEP